MKVTLGCSNAEHGQGGWQKVEQITQQGSAPNEHLTGLETHNIWGRQCELVPMVHATETYHIRTPFSIWGLHLPVNRYSIQVEYPFNGESRCDPRWAVVRRGRRNEVVKKQQVVL